MAEAETDPAPKPRTPLSRRPLARSAEIALEIVAVAFLVAATAGLVVQRQREALAESLAETWLRQHGVEGDIQVSRIDATGFSGRLRLGPANDPDLVADRVDVDYAFTPPWTGAKFSLTARSIRLVRPKAKLSFDGKAFHFGSLDPLVRDLLSRPKTDTPAPDIRVDDGDVRLTTPYGLVHVTRAQASLSEGKLRAAAGNLSPTTLKAGEASARIGASSLRATGNGEAIQAEMTLAVDDARRGDLSLTGGTVTLALSDVRYTLEGSTVDLTGQGRVQGRMATVAAGEARLVAPRFDLAFPRLAASLGPSLSGAFATRGEFAADSVAAGVSVRALTASVALSDARWSSDAKGFRLASPVTVQARAQSLPLALDKTRLQLAAATADFSGRLDTAAAMVVSGKVSAAASGALDAHDAARLVEGVPVLGQEPRYANALTSALRSFTLSAPAVDVAAGPKGFTVRPQRPVVLAAASGARAEMTPTGLRFDDDVSGALALKVGGGGLPAVALEAAHISSNGGQLEADATLKTKLDFTPALGVDIDAAGHARYGKAGFSFVASRCLPLSVDKLDLADASVTGIGAQLCPTAGAPLVVADKGAWRLTGDLKGGHAAAPGFEVRTEQVSGYFVVAGTPAGSMTADIAIADQLLSDTAKDRRFMPLRATGPLRLATDVWRGALSVETADRKPLAQVTLVQDSKTGAGSADIAARPVFAKTGLQLAQITPLIDVVDNLEGSIAFDGRLIWAKDQPANGSGRLTASGLKLLSPIGAVSGVAADVQVVSLMPLATARDQLVTAEQVDAFLPLKAVQVRFDLGEEALHLAAAQVAVADGRVLLEPMTVPLKPDAAFTGAAQLKDINLDKLVAATAYGDMIKADLVVDGRLPFSVDPQHFRLLKGRFATTRPGRLEISRKVLSNVETGDMEVEAPGALANVVPPQPAVNAFQDFTYQAMENLSVSKLEAVIESLPSGRLSTLFSIQGTHDPPVKEKAAISIIDLIRGQAFNKRIPLPKGTPIDLTLDTTLNLDELLQGMKSSFDTFRELHAPSRSDAVQR